MEKKKRVLIAGFFCKQQKRIVDILREIPSVEIVGFSTQGEETINTYSKLNPDIIFLDMIMQGAMTGLEAARWIKEQNNRIKIVLVANGVSSELLQQAPEMQVDGFLPKVSSKLAIERLIGSLTGVNEN